MRRENKLNDLTNREWLQDTKSFWHAAGEERSSWSLERMSEVASWMREHYGDDEAEQMLGQLVPSTMYSIAPPRDKRKLAHPATFSERDIQRLINLFTKSGQTVLDPFLGSGSTLLACHNTGRKGIGIELIEQWADVSRARLEEAGADPEIQRVIQSDAAAGLATLKLESVDFIVTSPPYWSILSKNAGMKTKAERVSKDLPTQYSDQVADLGNIGDYDEFLNRLGDVFRHCATVLKPRKYMACIVSDFRHGPKFYTFHSDLAAIIAKQGMPLKGITILLQDSKNLYPFAIPYAFVSNVHHQYILIHQKTV